MPEMGESVDTLMICVGFFGKCSEKCADLMALTGEGPLEKYPVRACGDFPKVLEETLLWAHVPTISKQNNLIFTRLATCGTPSWKMGFFFLMAKNRQLGSKAHALWVAAWLISPPFWTFCSLLKPAEWTLIERLVLILIQVANCFPRR